MNPSFRRKACPVLDTGQESRLSTVLLMVGINVPFTVRTPSRGRGANFSRTSRVRVKPIFAQTCSFRTLSPFTVRMIRLFLN